MTPSAPPLAETFERLRPHEDLCRAVIGRPDAEGWLRLDATTGAGMDGLFAAAQRGEQRRPDYVGASVAAALVDVLTSTAIPPLLVERRLPDVSAANLSVRLHDAQLWFEQVALDEPTCWALPGDRDFQHPTVEPVADLDELHRRLAGVLVERATRWFDDVRARAPFGRRGMWGQLADDVCGSALWTAREVGLDPRAAWAEANAIIDVVAAAVPELRVRPRLFPVQWSGGESIWQVKGTCCLWYTTAAEPDTLGDGFCTSCPLRPDDIRHDRLVEWLETQAATAG